MLHQRPLKLVEQMMIGRREFNRLGTAFSLTLRTVSAMNATLSNAVALAAGADAAAKSPGRTVKFPDGTIVPALGQGSWNLAQGRHPEAAEEEAMRTGLSLGMTLIDTAEIYGDGRSEEFIGRVIAGHRDGVFLSPRCGPATWREAASRVPVRQVSLVSIPIILTSICCTGHRELPTSLAS